MLFGSWMVLWLHPRFTYLMFVGRQGRGVFPFRCSLRIKLPSRRPTTLLSTSTTRSLNAELDMPTLHPPMTRLHDKATVHHLCFSSRILFLRLAKVFRKSHSRALFFRSMADANGHVRALRIPSRTALCAWLMFIPKALSTCFVHTAWRSSLCNNNRFFNSKSTP
ncbi:hypothetical protein IWX90DRAFT_39921 [Phyllosticta citrichinensis]|uniref:Secreted protein n=1 Tax=Phyllosticta citrichinensis TaxID=1130410 RepID=A0ABR1Y8E8_9PEZI